MKLFILASILLLSLPTFSQQLKSATGHQNNPYYSNTDIKKLLTPAHP